MTRVENFAYKVASWGVALHIKLYRKSHNFELVIPCFLVFIVYAWCFVIDQITCLICNDLQNTQNYCVICFSIYTNKILSYMAWQLQILINFNDRGLLLALHYTPLSDINFKITPFFYSFAPICLKLCMHVEEVYCTSLNAAVSCCFFCDAWLACCCCCFFLT